MKAWNEHQMRKLAELRSKGASMRLICLYFAGHQSRDSIVEAIDAQRRHPIAREALEHVNHVLERQNAAMPLINGKPAAWVAKNLRPEPMF